MKMMDKGSVDLDIVIPVTSDLHLNGSAGSINLTGVAGQIAIETNAGGIYVSLPRASSLAITSKTDLVPFTTSLAAT